MFRFVSGNDMFYVPWNGNGDALDLLCASLDIQSLTPGAVRVDGYSETKQLSKIRCNRVKSELIVQKGMSELHFTTTNHTGEFKGMRHVVIVTLPETTKPVAARITEPAAERTPEPAAAQKSPNEQQPAAESRQKPESTPEQQTQSPPEKQVITPQSATQYTPYCLALRTNLLYDAFLTPTLGAEWRVNPRWSIKADASFAHWGNGQGKIQRIWLVNPEIRRYTGSAKRFYVGASGNFGQYNIYQGMIGKLLSDDTGYQGKLWNAGLTAGYQLGLSDSFSLDFNLGLGYGAYRYDTFTVINEVRVYKDKNRTKDFWGPTQAGVSLVWTIGGNK